MSTIASDSPLNISQTVRDRGLVPKDHQYEMAYEDYNGHVTDDDTWPRKVKLVTPMREPISRKQLDLLLELLDSLLRDSTVGYASDSLASCYAFPVWCRVVLRYCLSAYPVP